MDTHDSLPIRPHRFWNSQEFVTPIVKVTRGEESLSFYTLPEYEAWAEANNGGHGWTSKYYKGLGTSTGKEAKEYFSDLENHEIEFRYTGEEEDGLIDMAFNRERADERKKWKCVCKQIYLVFPVCIWQNIAQGNQLRFSLA